MSKKLKLLCVLAHPDDESLGMGGALARYASEGVETYIVTATRGERGRFGDSKEKPSIEVVGNVRENELRCAAKILGVKEVSFLDYIDADLDKADPEEAISKIVFHIRRIRPDVIITFGPEGGYGHPDHIAISQFTTAAVVAAGDNSYKNNGSSKSHVVSKLYYMSWPEDKMGAYQAAFKDLKMNVDGIERRATPWPEWAVTTFIDTISHWKTVWEAVCCHKTQLAIYGKLKDLPEKHHQAIWGTQHFYRVFSIVNGGRKREDDLFEGLR